MIFAANLKCNHTRKSFSEYCEILDAYIDGENVIVFPPSTAYSDKKHKFVQGAQNFYPANSGSFTGEIGKSMLDEFGISTTLIGHSERRSVGENEDFLRVKFDFAAKNDFDIIYCIGESDIVYMNGSTKEFLTNQLKNIDLGYENLVVAYEPIWAIGTGKVASTDTINEILDFIAQKCDAPLLYGGSVNQKSINEISKIQSCAGVLVGTASWDGHNFINLIRSVNATKR